MNKIGHHIAMPAEAAETLYRELSKIKGAEGYEEALRSALEPFLSMYAVESALLGAHKLDRLKPGETVHLKVELWFDKP